MTNITTGARRVETFAGMFMHQASGLYLTLYRAYDPYSGRWLSRDPAGETGGINLYAYVSDAPVNNYDPSGLQALAFPGPPIPIPPAAIAGTPENDELVNSTGEALDEFGQNFGSVFNSLGSFGASTALATCSVHGNSLNSPRQTYLYQLTNGPNGPVLKYGITSAANPTSRYTASFYATNNAQMQVIQAYPNRITARIGELNMNIGYFLNHGSLPPMSSVP